MKIYAVVALLLVPARSIYMKEMERFREQQSKLQK